MADYKEPDDYSMDRVHSSHVCWLSDNDVLDDLGDGDVVVRQGPRTCSIYSCQRKVPNLPRFFVSRSAGLTVYRN